MCVQNVRHKDTENNVMSNVRSSRKYKIKNFRALLSGLHFQHVIVTASHVHRRRVVLSHFKGVEKWTVSVESMYHVTRNACYTPSNFTSGEKYHFNNIPLARIRTSPARTYEVSCRKNLPHHQRGKPLGARTLLGAPGIATSSNEATRAPGRTTRSKEALFQRHPAGHYRSQYGLHRQQWFTSISNPPSSLAYPSTLATCEGMSGVVTGVPSHLVENSVF